MSYPGIHLDGSMDPMEEARFLRKHSNLVKKLTKELRSPRNEIESILIIYYKFQKQGVPKQPAMTREQFKLVLRNAFDITDSRFCDLVTTVADRTPSVYFPLEAWVRVITLFLRGTLDDKIAFCFSVYDTLRTSKLTRYQMVNLLSHCIIGEGDTEEEVKDFIEFLSKKMDVDRDDKVSFDDFKETVTKQPLLLEAFGQCLPTRLAAYSFLTTYTHRNLKL